MLSPEQNERLRALFEQATELPPEQRRAFCVAQCAGDDLLLEELGTLLDVDRAGLGSFLGDALQFRPHDGSATVASNLPGFDTHGMLVPRRSTDRPAGEAGGDPRYDEATLQRLLQDRQYRLTGELSRGGMGVVLEAWDDAFGRPVAIKVMRRELTDSPYLLRRFVDEAHINGRLQHPGIVPVYDMGLRSDDLPYFAMKRIEGRTLAEILAEKPDAIDVLVIFEQVAHAVAYAHSRGVVHRDLKPQNVMVGSFGEVHVLDWGVARVLAHGEHGDPAGACAAASSVPLPEAQQSAAGVVIGTLGYMPPEQANGELALGPAADVFALGAMICELLTGRPAHIGDAAAMFDAARRGDLGEAHAALRDCGADPELVALVTACLAADPALRPRDASVVAGILRDHLRSIEQRRRAAEIQAAEARVMVAQERRARRLTVALTAVVAVALLGGAWSWSWWQLRARDRETRAAANAEAAVVEGDTALAEGRHEQALWSAQNVERLLGVEGATDELRRRLAPRAAAITAAARIALDNARLFAAIEGVRMPERGSPGAADYRPTDWAAVDDAYLALFRDAGLDPDQGGIEDSIARFAGRAAADRLAPMLDEWARLRGWAGRDDGARRLAAIAERIDPGGERASLRRAMRDGDLDALLAMAAAPALASADASTFALLANAFERSGRRAEAVAVLRQGCRRHAGGFALHLALARTLMFLGDRHAEEAATHYQAAVALRPDNLEARHELGRTLAMFLGQHERAVAVFRDLLAADPEDAHIAYHLGHTLAELGRDDEALAVLQRALALAPQDTGSLNTVGTIETQHGRLDAAIAAYRQAIAVEPGYVVAHTNLALALQRSGRLDEARAVLEHTLSLAPDDASVHDLLGIVAMGQQRHGDAVAHFERAVACDAAVPEYHTNLGFALSWAGRTDDAFAAYERALDLDPGFAKALYNIGTLNLTLQRPAEAERALWRCVRADPQFLDAYNALGGTFWGNDWGKVEAAYRRGVAANPEQAAFHLYLGEACAQQGRADEALAAYREALARDERLFDAHAGVGRVLAKLGRHDEALVAFGRARELATGDQVGEMDGWIARVTARKDGRAPDERR